MFIQEASVCESAIFSILTENSQGVSEYALLQQLQAAPYHCIEKVDLSRPIELFQTHFTLFHFLYQLQLRWLRQHKATLEIISTQIRLLPYSQGHCAIQINDPLAEYYLDWNNFGDATTNEDVEVMLKQFWTSFEQWISNDASQIQQALADARELLGVKDGDDMRQIKKRYHKLMHDFHPDKGGQLNKCQQIEQAYRQLLSHYRLNTQ
jgi:DnaJ-domain-containing protein 1